MEQALVVVPKPRIAPWLMNPMLRSKSIYLKVAIAAAMINVFALLTSIFTMVVYDRVVPNNATSSLIALSVGLAIVVVFDFVLKTLRSYFVDIAGARIDREVGEIIFERLLALRLADRKGSTGALVGIVRELETLREFFASITLTAMVDVPFILITLALIIIIGGPIAFIPISVIPLVLLVGILTRPAMDRLSAKSMGEGLEKQSILVEAISGLETVKTAGAQSTVSKRWHSAIEQQADTSLRQRLVANIAMTVAGSAQTVSYSAVVIAGVGMIADQSLTMGSLIACSILSGRAVAPLGQIASLLSRVAATRTAYRQLDGLMNARPEGPSGVPLHLPESDLGIEFRSVHFRYPGASEKSLENVSFTVQPGEHVALLGPVGSGKSTIAKLALGLYEPEEGSILINGIDIRQIDPKDLRRRIGSSMQESTLFSGSIRENILLDRNDESDAELVRAAQISGTHDFISAVANGYNRRLADRGEGLSGGQRQSIALARALVGRPHALIFDEPSSAMDGKTESALIQKLEGELLGRTVMIITHRQPLLRLVGRVIILDKGRVVADGPRDRLLGPRARAKAVEQ